MTAPGFQVRTADLRTHANVAARSAELLGQRAHVRPAGEHWATRRSGRSASSLLFSELLRTAAGPAISVLAQAQATMTSISKNVATAAANYDTVDRNNVDRFRPGTGTATPTPSRAAGTWRNRRAATAGGDIVTDVTSLEKDIGSGNWVQAGLAGLEIVSDATKILSDPVGAILQYGLEFPDEGRETAAAGGDLAGRKSGPGRRVRQRVAGRLAARSARRTPRSRAACPRTPRPGPARPRANYKSYAANQSRRAGPPRPAATRTLGSVTQSIGTLVATVQDKIKQMVSQAMSQIIQTATGLHVHGHHPGHRREGGERRGQLDEEDRRRDQPADQLAAVNCGR